MDSETRVLRAMVAGLPEEEFFWRLMEPAWDDAEIGTPAQQALARVTYFVRDAENGSRHQALWNRDSGEAGAIITALERLGASQFADLVRMAERLLLGNTSPPDLEERRIRIDARSSGWSTEQLDALDAQLKGEDALWPLFHEYVAAHPSEFFRD